MKKCRRMGCENEVTKEQMIYCSRGCAPLGHIEDTILKSGKLIAKSTTRARSGAYPKSSTVDRSRPNESGVDIKTKTSENGNVQKDENTTQKTPTESGKDGETSMQISQRIDESNGLSAGGKMPLHSYRVEQSDSNGSNDVTRLMDLVAPSVILPAGNSASRNLIDDTLLHLHSLMKDVATDAPIRRTSAPMIRATCDVAKQMRDLMKLKLDVYKVMKK